MDKLEIIETIYMEAVEDGQYVGYGICPMCGWQIPEWEPEENPKKAPDHDEPDFWNYVHEIDPDWFLGDIYRTRNGEKSSSMCLVFHCQSCGVVFGTPLNNG
jgi:hypothetical protein